MKKNVPRIMIAGTGSGCGKTTVTCGILSALAQRGLNVTSFKCGPDYIDPMFHREVLGTPSYNLDVFLCGENTVRYLLAEDSKDSTAVIEGVMGIYDGTGFDTEYGSANHIAMLTGTPQILVVNVRGKSLSLCAEVKGYLEIKKNNIKGLILNNCSERMYTLYKDMLSRQLGVQCLGYMPQDKRFKIGSRHLGLITAAEIDDIKDKTEEMGRRAAVCIDIDGILELAAGAGEVEYEIPEVMKTRPLQQSNRERNDDRRIRIGIARDKAFCFYYEDNLRLLEHFGADLISFSPLADKTLPDGLCGLILGGGYPEEHIAELSANEGMMHDIREAVRGGMPVYAECGGFMYLGESVTNEMRHETVGAIPGNSRMTGKLVRFGYKTLTARRDNVMCRKGEEINCHEFHYSDSDKPGDAFTATGSRGQNYEAVYGTDTVFAGYPHLHLWGNPSFAENFVRACCRYEHRLKMREKETTAGGGSWR